MPDAKATPRRDAALKAFEKWDAEEHGNNLVADWFAICWLVACRWQNEQDAELVADGYDNRPLAKRIKEHAPEPDDD